MNFIRKARRRKLINTSLNWDEGNPYKNGEYFILSILGQKWQQCFDIGANRGEYTKMLRQYAPEAVITSFEPNPESARYIREDHKTKLEVVAVGDRVGYVVINFNIADDTQSSSYRKNENTVVTKVSQTSIDAHLKLHKIKHVDFIKIDTEGHELAVIKGAKESLQKQRIDLIQFEYGGTYKDARTTLKSIYKLLSKNYIICHIMPQGILPLLFEDSLETYRYSNWLAISRNLYMEVKK